MSKPSERSLEQNPFDSRRTTRVTLVTPRNDPEPDPPAPDEQDDAGRLSDS